MKIIFLFIGLLSLLFFNQGEMKGPANHRNFAVSDETCQFESGNAGMLWDFEKNEVNIFEFSSKKSSQNKKRETIAERTFSANSSKNDRKLSEFLPVPNSKTNLFLIFHFSQALLQIFLL